MTGSELVAWAQIAQTLVGIGVNVAGALGGIIHAAHPSMTPEERDAACDAILADDGVREALARQASGG